MLSFLQQWWDTISCLVCLFVIVVCTGLFLPQDNQKKMGARIVHAYYASTVARSTPAMHCTFVERTQFTVLRNIELPYLQQTPLGVKKISELRASTVGSRELKMSMRC